MIQFLAVLLVLLAGNLTKAFALDSSAFRKGINLARLHNLPQNDPSKPGAFLWPPFQGALAEISEEEILRLIAAGFDFVRLPVAPAPFLVQTEKRRKVLLDSLYVTIKRLQTAGFAVLIDVHPNHSHPTWSAEKILSKADGAAFKGYSAFLQELARFSQRLPADKVALGLMNEPQQECHLSSASEWTRMQPLLYKLVRDVAPVLPIVLTTGCWSSPEALPHLDMKFYDSNTLVDVHYYRPYIFTHQGLPFASGGTRYVAGLEYPGPGADKNLTLFRSMQFIQQREADGANLPAGALIEAKKKIDSYYDDPSAVDRQYIGSHFVAMRKWVDEQEIEPHRLIVGEFGVARQQEGMPDIEGRRLWLKDVREEAEANGFGWALWDYNAGDGYPGFGLVFDNESRKIDPDMIDALGLDGTALRQ